MKYVEFELVVGSRKAVCKGKVDPEARPKLEAGYWPVNAPEVLAISVT